MITLFYRVKIFLFFSFFALVFTSCVSTNDIVYLKNDHIDQSAVSNTYTTVFKPDDLLQITISAKNLAAVKIFNLATPGSGEEGRSQLSYLIDSKGEIDFPLLGAIKIGGLSREEAILLFKQKLDPAYVKDPTINIRITNFSVAILGDVNAPGNFTIRNERITILQAIALAGDLSLSGQRNNIMVVREENQTKKEYRFDLRSKKLYTSPVYYLQQNDLVYVQQNFAKIQSASSNSNTTLFVSITGLTIAIMAILLR
jgi:polysaccharide export outer membrane protein